MAHESEKLLDAVTDEESFAAFVAALAREATLDAQSWENSTVAQYLEAAQAWSADTRTRSDASANPWKRCAQILAAARIYE